VSVQQAGTGPGTVPAADRVVGVLFAAIALAALGDLWRRGLPLWDRVGPGPAFLPVVLAVLLLGLSLILAAGRTVREAPGQEGAEEGADEQVPVAQTLRFIALIVALILLFPWLGGLLSLGLFVLAEMLWIERSRPVVAAVGFVATLAAVEIIFVRVLAVPLPAGPLGF
jgi:hypothetical protein